MLPLRDVRVVTIAVNVPGPLAASHLRSQGADVVKVEPPAGDPLAAFSPGLYAQLCDGVRVERLDLKRTDAFDRLMTLLIQSEVFLASHRPSALQRLNLDAMSLRARFPALRHVNIVGDTANPEEPGHDITYQARVGLLTDGMPRTLIADMAGAERAHAAINDVMREPGGSRVVGLYDVLREMAAPLRHGLTAPGGHLGGGNPAYAVYMTRDGRIAVGALEPHFRARLFEGLGLQDGADPSAVFKTRTALEWEAWAASRDLPLVAIC